ncbi:large-conductance mechanosensitive channel [Chytriomyces sp. MP71]|nr:large-conductance mechanosensitive channel [Chytriomyces sp. MP71]
MSQRHDESLELSDSHSLTAVGSHGNRGIKRLKEMTENAVHTVGDGVGKVSKSTMSVGSAFFAFINRGSVVDLAIGIVVGGAFTAIVNSFVNDLITPVIGLATQKNLGNLFLVIHCSKNSTLSCKTGNDHPYTTILQATTDGAATWNYGNFIQFVINFVLIAFAMFLLVQFYSNTFLKAVKKPESPKTKTCPMCFEDVNIQALKCKWCLTTLAPVESAASTPVPIEQKRSPSFDMFHKQR